jgi:hypothetical protein
VQIGVDIDTIDEDDRMLALALGNLAADPMQRRRMARLFDKRSIFRVCYRVIQNLEIFHTQKSAPLIRTRPPVKRAAFDQNEPVRMRCTKADGNR